MRGISLVMNFRVPSNSIDMGNDSDIEIASLYSDRFYGIYFQPSTKRLKIKYQHEFMPWYTIDIHKEVTLDSDEILVFNVN